MILTHLFAFISRLVSFIYFKNTDTQIRARWAENAEKYKTYSKAIYQSDTFKNSLDAVQFSHFTFLRILRHLHYCICCPSDACARVKQQFAENRQLPTCRQFPRTIIVFVPRPIPLNATIDYRYVLTPADRLFHFYEVRSRLRTK